MSNGYIKITANRDCDCPAVIATYNSSIPSKEEAIEDFKLLQAKLELAMKEFWDALVMRCYVRKDRVALWSRCVDYGLKKEFLSDVLDQYIDEERVMRTTSCERRFVFLEIDSLKNPLMAAYRPIETEFRLIECKHQSIEFEPREHGGVVFAPEDVYRYYQTVLGTF